MFSTKTSAAGLAILCSLTLLVLKLGVGLAIGSISILSEAIDSGVDLLAALIAYFSIRLAIQPADERHPFGHGKMENISGTVEAILIFLAAAFIVYEAVMRLVEGVVPIAVDLGLGVMLVTLVVNIFLSRHLLKVARATDSVALEADARNRVTDVYKSLGVLAGLGVVRLAGLFTADPIIYILDPLIGIGVAVFIMKTAYEVLRRAFVDLVDVRLPEEEEAVIRAAILEHCGQLLGFHELRTRKAGSQRYIDLHIVVAQDTHVHDAHSLIDHIEQDVMRKLPHSSVTVHIEPCDGSCPECPYPCPQEKREP